MNWNGQKELYREVVGLLPAGGQATRIAPLPVSKELYPVGFRRVEEDRSLRPKVVCHYLLEKMRLAGIIRAYIVLREGKWDIPAYLGDGTMLDMHLAYLMMRLPFGAPYTINQAYPFVQDALVAFGFPDIIFQPDDAFVQLLNRQATTNADIILGLFPADQPQKMDMVDLDENGQVRQIVIKPLQTHLRYTWFIAVWTPVFTRFMHEHLVAIRNVNGQDDAGNNAPEQRELFVGDVIQAAIHNDLRVETVLFPDGTYLDIGTPDDLMKAVRNFAAQAM
ncbi:MAG: dTDP-glucose pyrophosphorylase [Anaerolineae bacterium SM23_84]|nr:MAG: dTDP-glucose pyrophosphorylase [Anaerolineae bacterium SM23_84]